MSRSSFVQGLNISHAILNGVPSPSAASTGGNEEAPNRSALLHGLNLSHLILRGAPSPSLATASQSCDDVARLPTHEAEDAVRPRSSASSPIPIPGGSGRTTVGSKSDLSFEEQITLRELLASCSEVDLRPSDRLATGVVSTSPNVAGVALPPNADDFRSEMASASPKSSGFGLRNMVARIFHRSSTHSAPGDKAAPPGSSIDSPTDVSGSIVLAAASLTCASGDEDFARNTKASAELIYDAPFTDLSHWLLRKRHRSLNCEMCSLDWLTCDGGTEFDEKASLMKDRLTKLQDLALKNKSFSKGRDGGLVKSFVEWKLTKLAYPHMFPVHEFNDIILEARIRQLQFLQPCHLDLEGTWNEHFVTKAMGALQQMQYCHRPLDKLLCVDESSRLVCSMIGFSDSDDGANMFPGADEFFPPFLLLLIRTNPPHLSSTIEYCSQLLEGSWSEYPNLEILLSHLEACKQFVLTCTEKSFTSNGDELKQLLQRAEEENPLPFEGGCGDGIVVKDADAQAPHFRWLGVLKGSETKRPQRIVETLRIIDSAQERMTKANLGRSGK